MSSNENQLYYKVDVTWFDIDFNFIDEQNNKN